VLFCEARVTDDRGDIVASGSSQLVSIERG
jgi:hypothetical protein